MAKRTPNHKPGSPAKRQPPPPQPQDDLPTSDQGQTNKNPAAVLLGRLGGKKGGPARARKLTPQQRVLIARKAAQARWTRRPRS